MTGWRGRQDPQAKVWIQSRAGKDLEPNVYWRFTGRGEEVSRFDEKGGFLDAAAYAKLKPGEAAEITYDLENWSFWSPPYHTSGPQLRSPDGRQYVQVRFFMESSEIFAYGRLDSIAIEYAPLLADRVVGEVLKTLRPTIDQRKASVHVVNRLPVVTGDATLLGMALRNLISNGLKFNERSRPRVEIGCLPTDPPTLYVRDDGIGIEPPQQKIIFEKPGLDIRRLPKTDAGLLGQVRNIPLPPWI